MYGGLAPAQHAKDLPRQLRCEVAHSLKGGHCEERGEVRLYDLLLCERCARRLQAQDRVDLLQGIISCLELSLSNLALRRDASRVRLLQAERAQARARLALACEELCRASA